MRRFVRFATEMVLGVLLATVALGAAAVVVMFVYAVLTGFRR